MNPLHGHPEAARATHALLEADYGEPSALRHRVIYEWRRGLDTAAIAKLINEPEVPEARVARIVAAYRERQMLKRVGLS